MGLGSGLCLLDFHGNFFVFETFYNKTAAMKGKKGILLILVLLILVGVLGWQFFLKKKLKRPKVAKPQAPVEAPQESPPPQSPAPAETAPMPPPESAPLPPVTETQTSPPPGVPPELPQVLGIPETAPQPKVPTAQASGAESQPLIGLSGGQDLRLPEGTTLILESAKVDYQGQRKLQFKWELLSGPEDKIEIQTPSELQARVTLGNLEQPEQFVLRLHATDGLTEATDDVMLQGFPAQLKSVSQMGGAWIGVTHMGDNWVAARGRQLEVFGPDWTSLATLPLDFPIRQFTTMTDAAGKGNLYAQDPQGNWVVAQNDATQGSRITHLPMLGHDIYHLIPIQLEGQPYGFALLEKNIELWDFSDPRSPRLRKTLTTQLNGPHYLTFHGRHIYLADEQNIEIIDFSTGQPLASVASGGSITALTSYEKDGKGYLLAAIGKDRTPQKRQDYGLRIFEIDSGGRLGQEKRVAIDQGPAAPAAGSPMTAGPPDGRAGKPVEGARVIASVNQALLSVMGEKGLELKLFDLVGQKILPLKFSAAPDFVAIDEIATGKVGDQPVAVVADGNQLRVFSFQSDGAGYTVTPLKNFPGLLSAAWILSDPKGTQLWIGDEGTLSGGSLTLASGGDLKISKSFNAGGAFPVAAALSVNSNSGALLYLSSNPAALAPESPEAGLGLASLGSEQEPTRSKNFLGLKNAQGELRPLGVAIHRDETGSVVAVAISRVTGALGGSGIALWTQGKDQGDAAFLNQDLKAAQQLIPLQDARDVALSPDGKTAFVAGGAEGVIAVDLVKKQPMGRMSLAKPWLADRILLSHSGQMVLASFLEPTRGQVIVKIFGVVQSKVETQKSGELTSADAPTSSPVQLQEYGTLQGMKVVKGMDGMRAPRLALTEDDLYLFLPVTGQPGGLGSPAGTGNSLGVFNLTNPALPFKVAALPLSDEVRAVAVANRYKDVYVALGPAGVAKLDFSFIIPASPKPQAETQAESQPAAPVPAPESRPAHP